MSDEKDSAPAQETEAFAEAPIDLDVLAAEFFASPEQQERSEEASTPAEAAEEEAQPVQVEAQPEETAQEPEEDPNGGSPGTLLSPLLAQKAKTERELRAKLESAHEEAKQELIKEMFQNTPGFIEKYGVTQEQVQALALQFYAADLGDEAPPELKQAIGQSEADIKLAQMQKRIDDLEQRRQIEAQQARDRAVLDQYEGYIGSLPEEFKYLRSEASHDPAETLRTFAQVADHIYQTKQQYPSAAEIAQLIEDNLSSTAARYAAIYSKTQPKDVNQVPKATETVAKKPSPTLSNQQAGSSGKKQPVGEDELFEDALEWAAQQDVFKL